jgi:hypothetical protein
MSEPSLARARFVERCRRFFGRRRVESIEKLG